MRKYNDELVKNFMESELGSFIKENGGVLSCTVGETILIMGAATDYANDLLQGLSEKWQRELVVHSTLELTKKLMLEKRGVKYENKETKTSEKDAVLDGRSRQVGKKAGQGKAVHNGKSVR